MRLIRNLDEGDFGTFGGLKLKAQQMAKQLGVKRKLFCTDVIYSN